MIAKIRKALMGEDPLAAELAKSRALTESLCEAVDKLDCTIAKSEAMATRARTQRYGRRAGDTRRPISAR